MDPSPVAVEAPGSEDVQTGSPTVSTFPSISQVLPLPYEQIARFSELCELFTAARRSEIIHVLSLRPSTPSEINSLGLKLSFSGISQHLSKLQGAGLIQAERNAQSITYRICPEVLREFRDLIEVVLPQKM